MKTFDEWKQQAKYKGISDKILRRRYEQYASSMAGKSKTQTVARKTTMHSARSARLAQEASERSMAEHLTYEHLLRQEWFMALMDPFSDEASQAICPALEGVDVVPDATEVTVPVVADNRGRACMVFRPSLQAAYAVTNVAATLPAEPGWIKDITQIVWSAASDNGQFPQTGEWSRDSFSVQLMNDMPKANEFSQKYSHYAPQSAGVYFQTSENFNAVGGICYTALLGGDQGLPYVRNPTFNLSEGSGQLNQNGRLIERDGSNSFGGITKENLSKLKHTKTISVLKKLCFGKSWVPRAPRVCSDLRPTRYNPLSLPLALNGVTDCFTDGANNNEWLMPPTCSTNPDLFRAFWDRLCTLNPFACKGTASDGCAAPVSVSKTTLYGAVLDTSSGSASADNVATAAQNFATQFALSSMDDEDASVIMLFEGCEPGATIGYATFRVNIAGLNFTRSWGTASHPAKSQTATTQLIAAQSVAGKHVRYAAEEGNPTVMSSNGEDISDKVRAGAKTVVDIATTAADTAMQVGSIIGEVAPVAGEILGALAMLF